MSIIRNAMRVIPICLVLIGLSSCFLKKGDNPDDDFSAVYRMERDIIFFESPNRDKTTIVFHDGKTQEIAGEFYNHEVNMEGTKATALFDYSTESGGTLYFFDEFADAPLRIAVGVYGFKLADSGNGLIYWSHFNNNNETAQLHYLATSSSGEESRLVSESTFYDGRSNVCGVISPDGELVFYVTDVTMTFQSNQEGESTPIFTSKAFISRNGGESELFGENMFPYAIADEGKFVYYAEDSRLMVKKGTDSSTTGVSLARIGPAVPTHFNRDYSQIVFNEGEFAYISIDGGVRKRISDDVLSRFIIPKGAQSSRESHESSVTYGFDDFSGKVFSTLGNGLFSLDSAYDSRSLDNGNLYDVTLSRDGKTLFYKDGNWESASLKSRPLNNKTDEAGKVIAVNIDSYVTTSDGNIYYTDAESNALFRKTADDSGRGIQIADKVEFGTLQVYAGEIVYFMTDFSFENGATLHSSRSEDATLSNKIAEGVTQLDVYNKQVYYYSLLISVSDSTDYYEVFKSDDGGVFTEFTKVIFFGYNKNYSTGGIW
ncbi:MAG: hypothetical protein FWG83_01635 [Oscillospiraceae bacterium]|nr:hypothetical protein [Oscillospiraceae bacterium]